MVHMTYQFPTRPVVYLVATRNLGPQISYLQVVYHLTDGRGSDKENTCGTRVGQKYSTVSDEKYVKNPRELSNKYFLMILLRTVYVNILT